MEEWGNLLVLMADIAVLLIVTAVGFLFRGVATNSQRIAKLEATNEAVDVHGEVKDVHRRVDDVAKAVNNQAGQLTQINRTLGNIHEALIRPPGQ